MFRFLSTLICPADREFSAPRINSRRRALFAWKAARIGVGLLSVSLAGCRMQTPKSSPDMATSGGQAARIDSNQAMGEMLQSLAASINPGDLPFLVNAERARLIHEQMSKTEDPGLYLNLQMHYCIELLNAGETEKAIKEFDNLEERTKRFDPALWNKGKHSVRNWQALAYLRIGEQQNCCAANTSEACLLPIRGTGVHKLKSGSTRAMQIYEEILNEFPDDLQSRWLLNIAAMTIGVYPDGVPAKWRISPEVFRSEYDLKRFPNVAPQLGLNLLGRSGGCVIDDLDGDGNLDILISGIGFQDPLRLFHNNADGTFTERSKEAGLGSEMGGLNIVQADYNNDGHTDVFVLRGGWMGKAGVFPSSLLRNNGDGTFTDVTKEAGLLRFGPTQTAVWLDYNNDGLLDLFVAYESSGGVSHPCALFRNNGNGTFTDVAEQAGVNFTGYVKAVVSADYDNDGLPDLYLTIGGHEGGDNILFHNNGDGTFSNFAAKAGVTEPHHSFSAFFFDYDNDGWPDLFVIGYQVESVADVAADYLGKPTKAERPRLYHNNRNGTFTDVTKAMHLDKVILGMGIGYGDLDNDGYLDFYVGTGNPDLAMIIPKRMFRNDEGKRFQEVTTAGDFGHLQKGHAIAFADINNDGNQDIFEQLGGANFGDIAYSALYANPGNSNHWITLKLEGVQTNRSAIGARIKVTVKTASGPRDIYKTVSSGGSFGAGPLRQGIGLGKAVEIDHVEIYWPVSRRTQSLRGLAMDKPYQVREDKDQATPLALKTFAWPTTKAPAK